jgi:hypothetical protein
VQLSEKVLEEQKNTDQLQYLNNKVAPFTVLEHFRHPANFSPYFVPNSAEAYLVPGGEPVYFIEPYACEEIRDGDVFSDNHTTFRNICMQSKREKIKIPRRN